MTVPADWKVAQEALYVLQTIYDNVLGWTGIVLRNPMIHTTFCYYFAVVRGNEGLHPAHRHIGLMYHERYSRINILEASLKQLSAVAAVASTHLPNSTSTLPLLAHHISGISPVYMA